MMQAYAQDAYRQGFKTDNDILYTTRLRLNMDAKVADDVNFTGRMSMYKPWGASTQTGMFNGQANTLNTDANWPGVPGDATLKVDRAYFTWNNLFAKPAVPEPRPPSQHRRPAAALPPRRDARRHAHGHHHRLPVRRRHPRLHVGASTRPCAPATAWATSRQYGNGPDQRRRRAEGRPVLRLQHRRLGQHRGHADPDHAGPRLRHHRRLQRLRSSCPTTRSPASPCPARSSPASAPRPTWATSTSPAILLVAHATARSTGSSPAAGARATPSRTSPAPSAACSATRSTPPRRRPARCTTSAPATTSTNGQDQGRPGVEQGLAVLVQLHAGAGRSHRAQDQHPRHRGRRLRDPPLRPEVRRQAGLHQLRLRLHGQRLARGRAQGARTTPP